MTQAYVVRFVGGPLDGRVDSRTGPPASPKQTVTHVHLHGGPKIVHHYDLEYAVEYGCEYRLRVDEDPDETPAETSGETQAGNPAEDPSESPEDAVDGEGGHAS
ncbi:hypothetical protein [Saccharothrix lopnurensis]|uniref:ATP-grasp target RiPP n=1 Tax=Saccharothrix lopnurensis TaxID=1670621 RepID=A0ABW1PI07_9PSEU